MEPGEGEVVGHPDLPGGGIEAAGGRAGGAGQGSEEVEVAHLGRPGGGCCSGCSFGPTWGFGWFPPAVLSREGRGGQPPSRGRAGHHPGRLQPTTPPQRPWARC